jgi:oxygen-independent coproporphyrinogen-3 oxidase
VETIYFGGGTPGLLGPKRLSYLLKKIRSYYEVSPDAEITLETNPAVLRMDDYAKLRRAGFNRISIGVQSFNDDELEVLGRIHTASQAAKSVQSARKAGFDNINIDIMFGLPSQTEAELRETLETAVLLNPDHISFYGLKIEPNTPFADIQNELHLPDDEQYAKLYLYGVNALESQGYYQYEISNFAKDGYACRHNLKYWKLYEYVGFGPAAYSYLNFHRYGTPRNLRSYVDCMLQGRPVQRVDEETIDSAGQLKEYVMMSLRLTEGINRMVYQARFGKSFDLLDRFFQKLSTAGFAKETDKGWRLTPRGFLISNTIIRTLMDYISEEKTFTDL